MCLLHITSVEVEELTLTARASKWVFCLAEQTR